MDKARIIDGKTWAIAAEFDPSVIDLQQEIYSKRQSLDVFAMTTTLINRFIHKKFSAQRIQSTACSQTPTNLECLQQVVRIHGDICNQMRT